MTKKYQQKKYKTVNRKTWVTFIILINIRFKMYLKKFAIKNIENVKLQIKKLCCILT